MPDICLNEKLPEVRIGYILTREGRAWKEDALLRLTDRVNKKWPPSKNAAPDSGILWEAGYQINDPEILAGILEKRPDAFLVLSLPESSAILPGNPNGTPIPEYLRENAKTGRTSWELLTEMLPDVIAKKEGGA